MIVNVLVERYHKLSEAKKATIWFAVCSFLQRGISTLTTPVFTRLLLPGEYGEYSVFMSWLEIITVIVTLRLYHGIYMKNLVNFPEDRDEYSSCMLSLSILLSFLWFVVYLFLREKINDFLGLDSILVTCLFIFTICSSSFGFWSGRERVDYQYKSLILVTISTSVLKPLVSIVFIILAPAHRVYARIFGLIVVEVIIYGILLYKQFSKGHLIYNKNYWIQGIRFNLPLVPHYLSQIILNHSDRIMIQRLCDDTAAGVYSVAYNIAMVMILFNTSINNTLSPWTFKKLKKKAYNSINTIGVSTASFVAVINFILILIAPEVLKLFAPQKYQAAIYVIPPVSISVYFMFLYALFVNVEMYYGYNKYVMAASVVGALLNIVLNYYFIPQYGFIAAAYTTLACYIIYSLLHGLFCYVVCQKEAIQPFLYNIRLILFITIVFCASSFGAMLLYPYLTLRYFLIAIFIMIIFIKKDHLISKLSLFLK